MNQHLYTIILFFKILFVFIFVCFLKFELRRAGITVFSYPSRYESMILKPLKRDEFDNVILVAEKFLNQVVYIGWPHLVKAKVVAIFNREKYIDSDGFKEMIPAQFDSIITGVSAQLSIF